jgi:hypothetical protein
MLLAQRLMIDSVLLMNITEIQSGNRGQDVPCISRERNSINPRS